MSVKEQIRERMGATFDRWHFVAHQMTGQRSNYAYVMMHVVERLHESGGESIQITIPEWKATHGFALSEIDRADSARTC